MIKRVPKASSSARFLDRDPSSLLGSRSLSADDLRRPHARLRMLDLALFIERGAPEATCHRSGTDPRKQALTNPALASQENFDATEAQPARGSTDLPRGREPRAAAPRTLAPTPPPRHPLAVLGCARSFGRSYGCVIPSAHQRHAAARAPPRVRRARHGSGTPRSVGSRAMIRRTARWSRPAHPSLVARLPTIPVPS